MKWNNCLSRIGAGLLALALLLSLCPAALAQEGGLSIGTLEELEEFARRCSADTYSKGLTVLLTADIDAGGADISIPVFLGTFDGRGHKISGLSLQGSNSGYGLFSRIESGATVKNLSVEGTVIPAGTQSAVGGLAGENDGSIEQCSFSGIVAGAESVGGLAGRNGGTISGCNVSGVVRGTKYTGGVAGQSSGTILRCQNNAAVNTTAADGAESAQLDLESALYSVLKKEELEESAVTTDTGGIAGYSTGAIQSCTNTGPVGYPHVGYNVGGIAGRQNGYLANSTNRGEVQGRKDVGGVVGQMVPDITLQFSQDALEELKTELARLQTMIDDTLDEAQTTSDSVSTHIERLSNYADSASDSAHSLAQQTGTFVDDNVAAANELILLVERYLDKFAPILDDLSAASGSTAAGLSQSRILVSQLDGLRGYNDTALSQLRTFCTGITAACSDLSRGLDALDTALSLLESGPILPDTAQLRSDISALNEANVSLQATIGRALEEIELSGAVSDETKAQLQRELLTVLDCCINVASDVDTLLKETDLGGLRDQNEEKLAQITASFKTAMEAFSSASSQLGGAMESMNSALGTLRTINSQMETVFHQADVVLSDTQQAALSLMSAFSGAAQWARELSSEEPIRFSQLGPEFQQSNDALSAALTGMSSEISVLSSEVSAANTVLLSGVREINGQFMKVMNLFLNLLNNTQNVDYSELFEDVSEESLQSAARGKVLECSNYGTVAADRNAGGVAGAMAMESDLDPEDDLLSSDNGSLRFTYQTRAILLDCSNYGSVQAKKSCAGGVVGRMDVGTVWGCGGWGGVESESGDYVGGVAGLSLSSIRKSNAKCTLSGGKYVGGIAGSGSRISDCLSMVEIAACTQRSGAIAGEITGEYSGNRFVSETLAGVDRVSYAGKAEEISYEELSAPENVPKNFFRLTLRFLADGKVLKEQDFDYGASFSQEIYPAAPEKEDCYVRWDRTELNDLKFDTTVTALYEPYVTTLASEELRDGRAALLAEGAFRAGDSLTAACDSAPETGPEGASELWTLTVPDDGQTRHTVRWRIPSDGAKAYAIYTDAGNGWQKVESETIGSYVCFALEGERFAVKPEEQAAWWIWAPVAAGGVGAVCIAMAALHKKKKKA